MVGSAHYRHARSSCHLLLLLCDLRAKLGSRPDFVSSYDKKPQRPWCLCEQFLAVGQHDGAVLFGTPVFHGKHLKKELSICMWDHGTNSSPQGVRGYGASSTGLWVFPRTVVNAFGCWFVGRHIRVTGRYKHYMLTVTFITMLAVLGIATLWVPYSDRTPLALLCMMIEGFGVGTVIVGTMVALVADVAHEGNHKGQTQRIEISLFFAFSQMWGQLLP